MLEYVTQLVNSGVSSGATYKAFFASKYMNAKYNAFTYQNGKQDLPVQIYHTYRCGLLHGFSLVADADGKSKGARDGSIVFNSRKRYSGPNFGSFMRQASPPADRSSSLNWLSMRAFTFGQFDALVLRPETNRLIASSAIISSLRFIYRTHPARRIQTVAAVSSPFHSGRLPDCHF